MLNISLMFSEVFFKVFFNHAYMAMASGPHPSLNLDLPHLPTTGYIEANATKNCFRFIC